MFLLSQELQLQHNEEDEEVTTVSGWTFYS